MMSIDYSAREFFHQLTNVHWKWLLATLILIANSFKSWLGSRSHKLKNGDDLLLAVRDATGNTEPATQYWKPARGSEHRTLNPEP
jgi:hypothetical protein